MAAHYDWPGVHECLGGQAPTGRGRILHRTLLDGHQPLGGGSSSCALADERVSSDRCHRQRMERIERKGTRNERVDSVGRIKQDLVFRGGVLCVTIFAATFVRSFARSPLLVKEPQYLASGLFASGLLVGHDPVRGGDENVPELAGREQVHDPLLDLVVAHVEAGADDAALVQPSRQLNDDLLAAVVVHNFELANVPCGEGAVGKDIKHEENEVSPQDLDGTLRAQTHMPRG
jgi:hypothetical protein